jgi:hypothetical protein
MNSVVFITKEILRTARNQEKENLFGKMVKSTRETLKMTTYMDLVFTPIQKKAQMTTLRVIGKMARNQEKENLFGKMETNMREIIKMTLEMDLVLKPIQKQMKQSIMETMKIILKMGLEFSFIQKTTMKMSIKVVGRMARNQEKENLSSKMELSKKDSLSMAPSNINQSI